MNHLLLILRIIEKEFNCCVGKTPQFVLSVLLYFRECIRNRSDNDRGHGLHTILPRRVDTMLYGQLEFHALIILCMR